jgi:hypothetical protein
MHLLCSALKIYFATIQAIVSDVDRALPDPAALRLEINGLKTTTKVKENKFE